MKRFIEKLLKDFLSSNYTLTKPPRYTQTAVRELIQRQEAIQSAQPVKELTQENKKNLVKILEEEQVTQKHFSAY